jgi:hypothetical protein
MLKEDNGENSSDVIKSLITCLLESYEEMYHEIGVEPLGDDYYRTARFSRVWSNLSRMLLFVVEDRPEQEVVWVHSRFVFMEGISREKTALTKSEVPYQRLEEAFLVNMTALEWEDKLILLKFVTDGYAIRKPKIVQDQEMDNSSEDGQPPVYTLKLSEVKEIAHRTIFVVTEYSYPVRLRVLALAGLPLGLSVNFFDIEACNEVPMMFLIIHPRRLV